MSTFRCGQHTHNVDVRKGARKAPIGRVSEAVEAVCTPRNLAEVGAGADKTVFASRDQRFVYKVPNTVDEVDLDDSNWANTAEFNNSNNWRGRGVRPEWAAPTSAFVVDGIFVLSQPMYTPGDDLYRHGIEDDSAYTRLRTKAYEVYEREGIGDCHSGNYATTRNGQLRVIDLV